MFVCAQVFVSICMCACALGVGLMMPKMSKMKFLLYGILKFDKGNNTNQQERENDVNK